MITRRELFAGGAAMVTSLALPAGALAANEPKAFLWDQGGVKPFTGTPQEGVTFLHELSPLSERELDTTRTAIDKWYAAVGFDPKHPMVFEVKDGDEWQYMGFGDPKKKRYKPNVIAQPSRWGKKQSREYFLVKMVDVHTGRILEIGIPKVCGNPCMRRRTKGKLACIPLPQSVKNQAEPIRFAPQLRRS